MQSLKKPLNIITLAACLLLTISVANAQKTSSMAVQPEWVKDYEPFGIVGNLYYVGSYDLASYLIATDKGLILINTGVNGSETMIKKHVEQLGFKFGDIKILLATHGHWDHVGAMAAVKKMTGAKLMIEEKDAPVLADGGNSDYLFGGKGAMFDPVQPDVLLHDHDTVKLGEMRIAVLHHPGHTKGACSFMFDVNDNGRTYRVLIANMPSILDEAVLPSMPGYPDINKDYMYTFDAMAKLKFDIWLASHASQFDLQKKHKPGDAYNPAAFIDSKGYQAALTGLKNDYLTKLDKDNHRNQPAGN